MAGADNIIQSHVLEIGGLRSRDRTRNMRVLGAMVATSRRKDDEKELGLLSPMASIIHVIRLNRSPSESPRGAPEEKTGAL